MIGCIVNGVKSWLFSNADPQKVRDLMAPGRVGLLSARCCNPAAVKTDEQVLAALEEARGRCGVDFELNVENITTAQKSLRSLSGHLEADQQKLVDQLMSLFQAKGLNLFPVLIIDGKLAFYGGVPTAAMIEEKLLAMKGSPTAGTVQAGVA